MISLNVSKLAIFFIIPILVFTPCVLTVSAIPVMQIDYPFNADAEQPVPIFVNITSDIIVNEVLLTYTNPANGNLNNEDMNLTSGNGINGTWYFEIPAQTYKGSLNVNIIAYDVSGASASYDFIIHLEGPEPVKEFPWNIVVIVAFLAVTLVATELIFKPGVYRPTGRQKAAALEEEDRKRELESQEEPESEH